MVSQRTLYPCGHFVNHIEFDWKTNEIMNHGQLVFPYRGDDKTIQLSIFGLVPTSAELKGTGKDANVMLRT